MSDETNRFSKGVRARANAQRESSDPSRGLEHLDVHGLVERGGDGITHVVVDGRRCSVSSEGVLELAGRRWRLVVLDGRDALVRVH